MSALDQTGRKADGNAETVTVRNLVYVGEFHEAAVHAVLVKRLSGQGLLLEGMWKALIKNLILGLPEGIITMDVIVPFAFLTEGVKN